MAGGSVVRQKKGDYYKEEVKNVMCKIGDIILIERYKDREKTLGRHSFVVIDDQNGEIQGLPYDMICNVFSSFKNEEQKKRKLSNPGNFQLLTRIPIQHLIMVRVDILKQINCIFLIRVRLNIR